MILALLITAVVTAVVPEQAAANDKVAMELRSAMKDDPTTSFWVRFKDRPDLAQAKGEKDWAKRGELVVKALKDNAARSQADVIEQLEASGADYSAFYVSNTVFVRGGTLETAEELATDSGVASVEADRSYELPDPVETKKLPAVQSAAGKVEWGVESIGADRVWEEFEATGGGIVVGSIDSGAQFNHPALAGSYRGNKGDGTYDHNHNWFDPAKVCDDSSVPCDNNGHGTHTIGTMTGDAGEGNRIGVAPGAQWIAAKGCETIRCTEASLMSAAQWMLAPTDLDGNDPRPEMRPHIVNNSWGNDNGAATEPWFGDIVDAWTAAGMFPMFSNGNAGPGCRTSGSPGDYISTYAAGAYDSNGAIASFSARGSGEEDEVKPNIAAPGVAVRSARPGNAYAALNGTSMASPHVAGAIALMWSAAPDLVGDIDRTRALLDGTAVDVDDTVCGGTAEDNNVWGEGKLDVLSAISEAPVDGVGTLSGKVTDAKTGDPIGGVRVAVDGEFDRDLSTRPDGTFTVRLSAGDYQVSVSSFTYVAETADVTVGEDATVTADFALEPAAKATLKGTVKDGSGQGWPLYAKITADQLPVEPWYTDPKTGEYELTLPASGDYTFTVEPVVPGYKPVQKAVDLSTSRTENFSATVNIERCKAPGYAVKGLYETFDGTERPEGWTVVDKADGGTWEFDDPDPLGNRTPRGEGNFASVNSKFYTAGKVQDTYLITPVIDLSGVTEPELAMETEYFAPDWTDSTATIELSTDGGKTWEQVWQHKDPTVKESMRLPLPQAAGKSAVQVRFHYTGEYDMWWEIDDVLIGEPACEPVPGSLVIGQVTDRNTDKPLGSTEVRSPDGASTTGRSGPTPGDDAVADGLYWSFLPTAAEQKLTAKHDGFTAKTKNIKATEGRITWVDFDLAAGRLKADPGRFEITEGMNGTATREVTLTNTGTAPVTPRTAEDGGNPLAARTAADPGKVPSIEVETKVTPGWIEPRTDAPAAPATQPDPAAVSAAASTGGDNWSTIAPYPTSLMDPSIGVHDGKLYSVGGFDGARTTPKGFVYDNINQRWDPLPDLRAARQRASAAFIDDKLYITGGWDNNGKLVGLTEVYDPKAGTWTGAATPPQGYAAAGTAALDGKLYMVGGCGPANGTLEGDCGRTDVQVYDPASDTWSNVADYPVSAGWVTCGPIAGKLYCAGGMNSRKGLVKEAYTYDPVHDHWSPIAPLPVPAWASAYSSGGGKFMVSGGIRGGLVTGIATNEGYAYDPERDAWSPIANTKYPLYRAGSACGFHIIGGGAGGWPGMTRAQVLSGTDSCGSGDVDWLSSDGAPATIKPGKSATVTVTADTRNLNQPGSYLAGLQIHSDAPYATPAVDVALDVTPPRGWTKVDVTVLSAKCDKEATPLAGAYLEIGEGRNALARKSDGKGKASVWLPAQDVKSIRVIAGKDGLTPDMTRVKPRRNGTTAVELTLTPAGGCTNR
ncbi:S8 family serine peptidase [Streptomyces sp. NPDC058534]|uniref:S8 family serine peptidase n=1 Tax=Streptomyces sp. NPDC058534 TaxID=3346541 RepID=UPI00365924AA